MRPSVFNLLVDEFPEPGHTLIYNTLSGAFLTLDGGERALYDRAAAGDELAAAALLGANPGAADADAQFLVPDVATDEREWRRWYEEVVVDGQRALHATVSITFACNFECTYCCQADVLDGHGMKEATARATATWLARRAREIGADAIDLCFIGGEPLLYPGRIEQIAREIRAQLEDTGIALRFSLTTNGLLLTPALVERLRPLGLRGAQVTLDGDETTHDLTRRSKKRGEDTFATIFANVIACASLIDVNVNGNYQDDTVHGFPGLVRKLREAGFPAGARVHFSPALTGLGAPEQGGAGGCTIAGSRPELMLALGDTIARAGFDAGDPMSVGPCAFHWRHAFAIDPDGHVYKCPGFLGKPRWAIGHVERGLDERYEAMLAARPHERACGGCAHRPDCAGGCIAIEWLKTDRAEGVNCEGELFEQLGDAMVKRKYALAMAAATGEDPFALVPAIEMPLHPPAARGRRSPALRVLAA
jgi:uncharacterized protein